MGSLTGCNGALASAYKTKSNMVATVVLMASSSGCASGVEVLAAVLESVAALSEWYLQPASTLNASLSPQSQQPPPPPVMENEVSWPSCSELWKQREQ